MTVSYATRGAVAWVTLDRPEALNALDFDTLEGLAQAIRRAEADPAVRAVVLTGRGRAFCAGGDIAQLCADIADLPQRESAYITAVERCFHVVRGLSKPLVGAVNGVAVGGGLELLLWCDLVVASEAARMGDGHANFAIFPGGGSSAMLPRVLPLNLAKELLFTGELWSAAQWHAHGLVNRVVAPESLEAETQALAEQIATRSPRLLARLKRTANTATDKPLADALRDEMTELRAQMRTADMREGTAAFIEKRTPSYSDH